MIKMINCPFCRILNEKERIIKEGKNVFAILSNPKLTEGHTLIIPKRHVLRISELNEAERKELFETAIAFQEKIIEKEMFKDLSDDELEKYKKILGN